MPRGSGLAQKLMEKRRELEKAIETIDAAIRLIHGGKIGGRGRGGARRPMSEEQKRKISEAATKRHAQARRAKANTGAKTKHTNAKPINRPRPKQQEETGAEA